MMPAVAAARPRRGKVMVTEDLIQAAMSLHLEVIIHRRHGALTMDEAAVIVIATVTEIVTDIGVVNEMAADEEDQSTGHRRAIVIRAGKGEDLNPDLGQTLRWKKNMELGRRHFYMDLMMSI